MALARQALRKKGVAVCEPMATNETNAAAMVLAYSGEEDAEFVTSASSRLMFNAAPSKMSSACVMTVSKKLAQAELDDYFISEKMGYNNQQLSGICRAITKPGEYDQDAVWSSWFLIVYLMSDPRGRIQILTNEKLTDVDYHTAIAMENYGRAELTRRARLRKQRLDSKKSKKAKTSERPVSPASSTGLSEAFAGTSLEEEEEIGEEDAELLSLSEKVEKAEEELVAADDKVIATKRRRSGKGQASASSSDANGLLEWWWRALRNPDKSVLLTLVAWSRPIVCNASVMTLERQVGKGSAVANNDVIRHIAANAAMRSAEAIVPLVGRRKDEIPSIKVMDVFRRDKNGAMQHRRCAGFNRVKEQERTTLLMACKIKKNLQPAASTFIVISHVEFTSKLKPALNEASGKCPNVLERIEHMSWLMNKSGASDLRREQQLGIHRTWIASESSRPGGSEVTGMTRSVLSMCMWMAVCDKNHEITELLVQEFENAKVEEGMETSVFPQSVVVASSQDEDFRQEPFCSGNSPLVSGVCSNETLRVWMHGRSRRGDVCKLPVTRWTSEAANRDAPAIVNTEPLPLLTITDFKLECDGKTDPVRIPGNSRFKHHRFCAALNVCGEGVVRVPEIVLKMDSEKDVMLIRSMILVSMSQASYIGEVGSAICAGYANAAIASSKKMSVRKCSVQTCERGNCSLVRVFVCRFRTTTRSRICRCTTATAPATATSTRTLWEPRGAACTAAAWTRASARAA